MAKVQRALISVSDKTGIVEFAQGLAKLNVDPSDFQIQPSNVAYSKQKLDELEQKLNEIKSQVDEESTKLSSLKALIWQRIGISLELYSIN